jgi:hypothetical protein
MTTTSTSHSIPRILPPPPPPQRHPRRPVPPIHAEQALSLSPQHRHDLKTSDPPIPTTIQDSPSTKPRAVLAHRDNVGPDESMDVQHVEKRHSDIVDYEMRIASPHLDSAKSSPVDGNSMLRKPSAERFLRASSKRNPLVRHKRKYRKFQPSHTSIYSPPYSPVSWHRSLSLRRSNSRRNLSTLIRSSIVKITNVDGISSSEPKADLREEFLNALDAGEAARNSLQRSLGLGSNRPSLVLESPQEQQQPKSSWEATPSPPASPASSSSPLSSLDLPSIYMKSESGSQPPTAAPAWSMRTANEDVPWRELCVLAEFQGVPSPEEQQGDRPVRGSDPEGVSPQDEDDKTRRQEHRLTFFEDEKVSDDASLHDDDVLADDEATPDETEMHLPTSKCSSPWVPLTVLADDSINHIDDDEPAQSEQQNTSTLQPPSHSQRLSAHRPTRDQEGVATIYSSSRTRSQILSEYDAHSIHLPEYALDLMQELDRIRASFRLDPMPLTTPFETDEDGGNRTALSHAYHIHRHPFAAHPDSESSRVLSIGAVMEVERPGGDTVAASAADAEAAMEPVNRSSDDSFATTKTTATATTFPRISNETAATAYTSTPPRSPSSHYPKLDRIATTIAMRTTAATKTTNDKFFRKSSGHSRSQSLSGTAPYRPKTRPTPITIHDEDHQDQQGPTDFPTLYSLFSIPERLSTSAPLPSGRLAVSEVPSSTAYRRRANSFFTPRCVNRGSAGSGGGMKGSLEKSPSSFEDHTIVPLGRQGSIKDRVMRQFSLRLKR